MSFPNPAERADWFRGNFEGHAPTAHLVDFDRYVPACTDGCIDPAELGVLVHSVRANAVDQAVDILAGRIHGPAAGQENTP